MSRDLLGNHPKAFSLLTLISMRARVTEQLNDGLAVGECYVGDHDQCGLSRREYRTALELLMRRGLVEKVATCRNPLENTSPKSRQKAATLSTTKSTIVKLLSSDVYDLNFKACGHLIDHTNGHLQAINKNEERITRIEKEKINKKEKPESARFCRRLNKFIIPETQMQLLRETFPGVDIEQNLRMMRAWLMDTKNSRRLGSMQFIRNWLSRCTPIVSKPSEPYLMSIDELEKRGLIPDFGRG